MNTRYYMVIIKGEIKTSFGDGSGEKEKITEILEKNYFDELLKFGREHFNYIIMDCAPLGAAIDAAVVAKHCDGAILVVAQGMASGRMILSAKKQLEVSGVRILGAVLNKVKAKKNGHANGYYGNYYGKEGSE